MEDCRAFQIFDKRVQDAYIHPDSNEAFHPEKTTKPDGKHGRLSTITESGLFRRLGKPVGKRADRGGGSRSRGKRGGDKREGESG